MTADGSTSPPLLNVQIDGVWHQFPKGTRVIEACEKAGSYIPRYCYHKRLSSPGNCRMCLIEMGMPNMGPDRKPELGEDGKPVINWMPRPAFFAHVASVSVRKSRMTMFSVLSIAAVTPS